MSSAGIIGNLRILVDADTSKAQMAMRKMGGQAGLFGATVGAGLGIAAVAGLKIGDEYKKATDAIRIGTGKTGAELEALEGQFKSLATRVPNDLAAVGTALASVSTRTGATGDDLGALTESFLDMSRLLKLDTENTIASVTRLYGDWGIAAKDQIATNDLLLRASQASGMALDQLAEQMVQFGAPLRNIGIEFEGAVAMLAKWEKEGVNTTLALGGLKIALGEFAKEGIDAKEGLDDLIERIQNTDDVARAMALGVGKFGSRAGPDMVAAIREGRFEFEDFEDVIKSGTETVQGLSDDSRDFGDAIREMGNRVKVAVGPITDSFAGIADAMGNAIFLLPAMTGALGNAVGRGISKLGNSGAVKAATKKASAVIGRGLALGMGKYLAAGNALSSALGNSRIGGILNGVGTKWGKVIGAAAVAMVAIMVAKELGDLLAKRQEQLAQLNASDDAAEKAFTISDKPAEQLVELQGYLATTQEQLDKLRRRVNIGAGIDIPFLGSGGIEIGALADTSGLTFAKEHEALLKSQIAEVEQYIATNGTKVQSAADSALAVTAPRPDIAGPIRAEFQLATAEVAAGFGSVKQALANPPQMISKGDRLGNMAKRMKKVMANIKKATEVGDPMAQRYWEKARTKQQQQIDKLKTRTTSSLADVKAAYTKAGVKVGKTWETAKTATKTAAKQAADGAITQAERIPTAIDAMDLHAPGVNLMTTWAQGIRDGTGAAVQAATDAAAAVAAVTVGTSPPPKGPLRNIDKGGRNIMSAWLAGFDPKRAAKVGSQVAGAMSFDPSLGGVGAMSMGMAAMGAGGDTFHIGVLVADEGGIDQLERRMDRRRRRRNRGAGRS